MWREFKAFILKGEDPLTRTRRRDRRGAAKVVSALVADFIMPIATFAVPGGTWRTWTANVAR